MNRISNQNALVRKCQNGKTGYMAGAYYSCWKDPKSGNEFLVEIDLPLNPNVDSIPKIKNIEKIIDESPSN
ncbi:hypothetical protein [uncultured Mediterranean phage uvMED]|nr:hypothetical protein [uncultured Mediterranean phage uvMED]BAR37079.1 hypothetical protein [uncultured Mediterranean phage uvMED]